MKSLSWPSTLQSMPQLFTCFLRSLSRVHLASQSASCGNFACAIYCLFSLRLAARNHRINRVPGALAANIHKSNTLKERFELLKLPLSSQRVQKHVHRKERSCQGIAQAIINQGLMKKDGPVRWQNFKTLFHQVLAPLIIPLVEHVR